MRAIVGRVWLALIGATLSCTGCTIDPDKYNEMLANYAAAQGNKAFFINVGTLNGNWRYFAPSPEEAISATKTECENVARMSSGDPMKCVLVAVNNQLVTDVSPLMGSSNADTLAMLGMMGALRSGHPVYQQPAQVPRPTYVAPRPLVPSTSAPRPAYQAPPSQPSYTYQAPAVRTMRPVYQPVTPAAAQATYSYRPPQLDTRAASTVPQMPALQSRSGCASFAAAMHSSMTYYQQNPSAYQSDLALYNRTCQ
jgi:hypothetical protein